MTALQRAVAFVLVGIASVQLGAAVAKDLFDRVDPTTMTWLRLVTCAALLLAVARPRLRGRSRADWAAVLGLGASLGLMNWAIYQSFSTIPIGMAVTIEFVGPLVIAVVGSRHARDLLWVGLAGLGVVLLGFSPEGITVTGALFALLAGAGWASYIVFSAGTGRRWPGLDGLVLASAIAVLPLTPYAVAAGGSDLLDPTVLGLGAAVGLLSSVVPYSLELSALRVLPPRTFGILMSLEPGAAALAALLVLGETLTPLQWLAMACVIAASIGATAAGRAAVASEPVPD